MARHGFCAAILLPFFAITAAVALAGEPQSVDEAQRVVLVDSVHPLARQEFDHGPVPETSLQKIVLVLKPRPGADQERDDLLARLYDPSSPSYHQWLTPDEYGARFGPSDEDLNSAIEWLNQVGPNQLH